MLQNQPPKTADTENGSKIGVNLIFINSDYDNF